jgi:hypothetical protein
LITRESETPRTAAEPTTAPASGPGPLADLGLLVGRLLVGFVMAAHGWQKLTDVGPAAFGRSTLAPAGVPMDRHDEVGRQRQRGDPGRRAGHETGASGALAASAHRHRAGAHGAGRGGPPGPRFVYAARIGGHAGPPVSR